jgi:regulator of replication initiation timing
MPNCCRSRLNWGLLTLLAGCATTGDPRSGGLFGWREEQALGRQQALVREDDSARQQADAERDRTTALQSQQHGLSAEASRLQVELDRLLTENTRLEARLRELMQKRQLAAHETARLRKVLADNAQLRSTAVAQAPKGPSPTPTMRANTVNDQNGRLHRELLIL